MIVKLTQNRGFVIKMPKIEIKLRALKSQDEELMVNNLIERIKFDIEKRGIKVLAYNTLKYRGKKNV